MAPINCNNSDKLPSFNDSSELIFELTKSFRVSLVVFDTIIEPNSSKRFSINNSVEY